MSRPRRCFPHTLSDDSRVGLKVGVARATPPCRAEACVRSVVSAAPVRSSGFSSAHRTARAAAPSIVFSRLAGLARAYIGAASVLDQARNLDQSSAFPGVCAAFSRFLRLRCTLIVSSPSASLRVAGGQRGA
ncbi:hypothetical protein L1887_59471 [Cichorium endivia]|nr:hypothetical protein L1887_59471 [Cichorium endivia]